MSVHGPFKISICQKQGTEKCERSTTLINKKKTLKPHNKNGQEKMLQAQIASSKFITRR